jgi:hypothetical protein
VKRLGPALTELHIALQQDRVLRTLAETPLMLSIMSLAYQRGGADSRALAVQPSSPEERRHQLFDLYVERMFQRKKSPDLLLPKDQVMGWLSWLAKKMKDQSQSVFMVEELQPSWLASTRQRIAYGALVGLIIGLIVGLSDGLVIVVRSVLSRGLNHGLSRGLSFGVAILLGCWLASPLKNGASSALIVGLIGGLDNGLIGGLIGGAGVGSLNRISLVEAMSWNWRRFWRKTIRSGLIVGLIGGLIAGVLEGMTDQVTAGKTFPNQGIKLSAKNATIAALIGLLSSGLIFGPIADLILTGNLELIDGLTVGLIYGLSTGLIFGLNRGGSAVVKHYFLRLILWLKGYTPFRFIQLLDDCAKMILLKKVGGGYIFIHRMFLEYCAELNSEVPTNIR